MADEAEHFAKLFHVIYEREAQSAGWKTQESCQVDYADLPEPNRKAMEKTMEYLIPQILESAETTLNAILEGKLDELDGEIEGESYGGPDPVQSVEDLKRRITNDIDLICKEYASVVLRDVLNAYEDRRVPDQSNSKEEAYIDRNLVVQGFARLVIENGFLVGVKKTDPEWPIIYVELPTGQISYHIPAKELVVDLPEFDATWDGHSLEEKRDRLKAFLGGA